MNCGIQVWPGVSTLLMTRSFSFSLETKISSIKMQGLIFAICAKSKYTSAHATYLSNSTHVSDSEMNEWSPPIHCNLKIFSKMQYCIIEGCCCLRRIKSLQSIAKKMSVGVFSYLGGNLIQNTPHGSNDTTKASKLESCSKMHGLTRKML